MKSKSGFSLAMASLSFGTFDISNYSWHGRNQEQCQGFEIGTEAFETLKGVQHSSFTSLLAYWRQKLKKTLDTQKSAMLSVLRTKRKYCDMREFRFCF